MKKIILVLFVTLLYFTITPPIHAQCCADTNTDCTPGNKCQIPLNPSNPSIICTVSKPGMCVPISTADQGFTIPRVFDVPALAGFKFLAVSGGGKETLGTILSALIPYVFAISGLLLFFYLLYGAFNIVSAMGEPAKIATGSKIITHALVGFAILFTSYWLMQLLQMILDLKLI